MTSRVLIVGGSVAGIKTATALRTKGFSGAIQVVDRDGHAPYDKPPLSKEFLTGSAPTTSVALLEPEEYEANGIELLLGHEARGIDTHRRTVTLGDGTAVAYDVAVIATGARASRLPLGPPDLAYLRGLEDALVIRSRLARSRSAVVVGGGVLGCELASVARGHGLDVTIVECGPGLMIDALGRPAASLLASVHREHGVDVRLGTSVREIEGSFGNGYRLALSDGTTLECDLVLVAVGDRPNVEWLAGSPLEISGGILTEKSGVTTTVGNVFAVGDVAVGWGPGGVRSRQRHWTAAVDQAEVVAHNIVHGASPDDARSVEYFWSDQYGLRIQTVGTTAGAHRVTTIRPLGGSERRRLLLHDDGERLTGAVTIDWPKATSLLRGSWFDRPRLEGVIDRLKTGSEVECSSEHGRQN